jgi:hypothetical protein
MTHDNLNHRPPGHAAPRSAPIPKQVPFYGNLWILALICVAAVVAKVML